MTITLRPAIPVDAEAVGALLAASYPVLMRAAYPPDVLAAALPAMVRANPVLLASGTYHLALGGDGARNRKVVGAGGWTRERPGTGAVEARLGHIRHFATHPDWTGRGVGRAILEICLAEAGAAGCTALECYASHNAEGFYAARGFAPVRPLDIPMGNGVVFPSLLMQRTI